MFTDLVGSTAEAQRDERSALDRQDEQERILRPIFGRFGGLEIKRTGDGFLVEFESALRATQCALEAQRALRERNSSWPTNPLLVRIGIHLGDVEERGGDIFGDAVNIAARVEPYADPGGICLSEPVYAQVGNKVSLPIERIGPRDLRGVREPMELYRVVLPWMAAAVAPGTPRLPRLAVLPLTNISPDPSDEYFADGLTEELITVLSQIKGLRVISRTSISQYKGVRKPVVQIGAELGADSVLEGSVRKAGDQLRIVVQLIDTRTDEHRWAQTYDRRLENVFAIQADVAERAAAALKVELLGRERETLQHRPTPNLGAYEAYLRGIQAGQQFAASRDPNVDARAERCFEEAIQQDPSFGAAYARLARHLTEVMGEVRPTSEVAPRIRTLVARALELGPDSPESYLARGYLRMQVDHDWAGAESDFLRAIALNPSDSTAHRYYGHLLGVLQRYDEAAREHAMALEQDPLDYTSRLALASIPLRQGAPERSHDLVSQLVEEHPEFVAARLYLGAVCALTGRLDAAVRAVEPLANRRDPFSRADRALVLALAGRRKEAEAFVAEWEAGQLSPQLPLRSVAELYAALGKGDRALDLLERDAKEGDNALWASYSMAIFDALRGNPRFRELLRALNLPTGLPRPPLFPRSRSPN